MSDENEAESDVRVVARFAWFPERLENGRWIHLRWFRSHEVFEPDYSGWTTGLWVRVRATVDDQRDAATDARHHP